MINILSASAGSGKTYALSHKYLELLLKADRDHAYRNILAVTFTNKATGEMKARILKDLFEEGRTNPKARKLLLELLHDYSAFSVMTIDKFFQMALRSFSRELGWSSAYQIELDRASLIKEAMDRVLDSLSPESTELLDWLRRQIDEQLSKGEKFSIDEPIYAMGMRLKNEKFRILSERTGLSAESLFSKERLSAVRGECDCIIEKFTSKVVSAAEQLKPCLKKVNSIKQIEPYIAATPSAQIAPMKATLAKESDGSLLSDLLASEEFRLYNTAFIVRESLFSLGFASEFHREFDALLKEKNLLCLDESNTILRDIIDGSDAPFVYEKMGVRYMNFLLDEFQDTSGIQWENFLPMLRESESNGYESFIVGDVKQSIYRWRDSDWSLMAKRLPEQFPDSERKSLKYNWRSYPEIVDFNNRFFEYLAPMFGLQKDIYIDTKQEVARSYDQRGEVKVDFVPSGEIPDQVLASIYCAREHNARWSDIAVLVRGNKQGRELSRFLLEQGVPVVSDESLMVGESALVRTLLALMSASDNPSDTVSAYLTAELNVSAPQNYHSLVDFCEALLRGLRTSDPELFDGQTLFIQAFMDDVLTWSSTNGNNLHEYLRHWKETGENLSIAGPADLDAVRIITVHKSKGLEFNYLIFPYAEKVELWHDTDSWCELSSPAIPEALHGIYPVNLCDKCAGTWFAADYEAESKLQIVDNINVFYVALTRAKCSLHVIAAEPAKKFVESLDKEKPEWGNFSQFLYAWCRTHGHHFGEEVDFARIERKSESSDSLPFEGEWCSTPINPDESAPRLACSQEAADFFGEEGVGSAASARIAGIELHALLSAVHSADDLHDDGSPAVSLLRERIAAHPDWFAPDQEVHNEMEILAADGSYNRPDRVVRRPDGSILVIDYKFGEPLPSYRRQVRRYMDLLRAMGEKDVRGYLWYVREDKVETVE